MDIFPRPDIAAGIFFDYFNEEDPISSDFITNAVDGFPFLLAPLSQVKLSSGIMASPMVESRHEPRPFVRAIGNFAGMLSSRTEDLSDWLHGNANAMMSRMASAAQSAGDAARSFGEEMDRRREQMMRQAESSFHFVASRMNPNRRGLGARPNWMKGLGSKSFVNESLRPDEEAIHRKPAPRGRAFGSPLSHWLGEESQEATLPDEIGPMIHPTMNLYRQVFLAMVHLYLLLLLIVSLPGPGTKLVVRRKRRGYDLKEKQLPRRCSSREKEGENDCQGNKIRKSLSYFL